VAVRIIGIDPGLRRTGWGMIVSDGSRLIHVEHGVVTSDPALPMAERLLALHTGLAAAIACHDPAEAAIEETFVNRDAVASLKLGHARGAALLAISAAGLACGEYAPNRVKKSVVGRGHADKRQIAAMVSMLLNIPEPSPSDAADALAVAITHAHHRVISTLVPS
jgi:crossover junction endodeoxyribonuclease RuvC